MAVDLLWYGGQSMDETHNGAATCWKGSGARAWDTVAAYRLLFTVGAALTRAGAWCWDKLIRWELETWCD